MLPFLDADHSAGGYAGLPVDLLLRMRSGARTSDLAIYHGAEKDGAARATFRSFIADVQPGFRGRGKFRYLGVDTQVIALLVQQLTGAPLDRSLQAMWRYLGMEADARWLTDHGQPGTPAAYCCFDATARDLARFGRFVLARGTDPGGVQQIASAWFDLATTRRDGVDDSIPRGSPDRNPGCPLDYRYQWWLFPAPRTDFTAVGRSGQFIHVMPDDGIVIVQISDWGQWIDGNRRECETFRFHDAVAEMLRE